MLISIVGTRPNLVKLAPIVWAAQKKKIKHQIIHTGQHYDYEMSQVFFEQLEIPSPDKYLKVGSGSDVHQIGETVKRVGKTLDNISKPALVLVYGDTNATVGSALGAKKSGFYVVHIESGVRTYDYRLPEELNRLISESCSDLLFAPTKHAYENIKSTNRAKFVGDVMYDTLLWAEPQLNDNIIKKISLKSFEYYLLTLHRGINVDSPHGLKTLLSSLKDLALPIIFPAHPRTKRILKQISVPSTVEVIEPLGYFDFLSLLKNAKKVLTDSGGVQKEAYSLGVPCITLLDAKIWPETIEAGWNFSAGSDVNLIKQAIASFNPNGKRPHIFGNGQAAKKIINTLRSCYQEVL